METPSRGKAETPVRLSTGTPVPSTKPIDRPTSPNAVLPQQLYTRSVGENDRGAAAVAKFPSASPPPLSQPSPAPNPALEGKEWEIREIVDKRRAGRGFEYKVRWEDTWLPKCELGNAQRLLQEFEAQLWP